MLARLRNKLREDGLGGLLGTGRSMAGAWCGYAKEAVFRLVNLLSQGRACQWHGFHQSLSDQTLATLVGMTTKEERAFLQWYASAKFQGRGVMVELGPFVGASTAAICSGLISRQAGGTEHGKLESNRIVRVYDRFVCTPNMVDCIRQALGPEAPFNIEVGASCRPLFDLQTKEYANFFTLHDGDLLAETHDNAPIEFLFIDAMKTPELAKHVVRQFYPSLIPGHGVLVQQDFVHYYASWIHILQYRLRHLFRFVLHVPRSASAVFEVVAQDPDLASFDLHLDSVSDEEVDAAFDYSLSLIRGSYRENIHAAKAMFFVHIGRPEVARCLVTNYVRRHGRPRLEMQHVERVLAG